MKKKFIAVVLVEVISAEMAVPYFLNCEPSCPKSGRLLYHRVRAELRAIVRIVVLVVGGGVGGGGFFLACEDFGIMLDRSFPACAFKTIFF